MNLFDLCKKIVLSFLAGFLITSGFSKKVEAQELPSWFTDPQISLSRDSFFAWTGEDSAIYDEHIYQTTHCANSLEIPLWDNPSLSGIPKRYTASAPQAPYQENTFSAMIGRYDNQDVEKQVGKWWTSSILNGKNIFEKPSEAKQHKVKSWPIRAVVLVTGSAMYDSMNIKTIQFTPTGQAVEGYNKKLKKQVSLTCGQLFLINQGRIESPLMADNPSLSYLPTARRLCNFYPNGWPEFMFTEGSLEEHRKNLLTYCKGGFPEAENRPDSQLPTSIRDVDPPQLQSFIPSELDLTKPITKTHFVLTVRFEDPVQPVYHQAFPKVCLADCPNSGAQQIHGIELKREAD
jgi:hypothetical protein